MLQIIRAGSLLVRRRAGADLPQWWFVLCWVCTECTDNVPLGPSVKSFGKKTYKTNPAILSLFSLVAGFHEMVETKLFL